MSSSVFFKFKSQKDPQRVTFDGTGISVFELKREIINISKLGDGTDFDLSIYNEDNNEVYDDDTAIIPCSTSVIARRLPASKPGQGRAARYVSGKMPVYAKNSYRSEKPVATTIDGNVQLNGMSAMSNAQTEEERIAAMHMLGSQQWQQQQQHMASATAVHRPGGARGKVANVPDHPPPAGYVCYRCGEKNHWIQECPTNNDPNFDGRPRVKRTTGIPKSMLQTVAKPEALSSQDGLTDESNQPSGVMVDAEGNFVVSVPDKASWEQYQAKAQASAAQEGVAAIGSRELQDRGLECPIDKRMFVDPMKTPCCGKTYCHDCIENALVNSDLVCPNCSTEGVLIDNLTVDEDMVSKVKQFEEEQRQTIEEKDAEGSVESPKPANGEFPAGKGENSPRSPVSGNSSASTPTLKVPEPSKKRPAEDKLKNDRKGKAPTPTPALNETMKSPDSSKPQGPNGFDQDFVAQMNALAGSSSQSMAMPFDVPMNFNPKTMSPMAFPGMPMNPQMMMNPQMFQMMMQQGMGMPLMGMSMPGSGFPANGNVYSGFGGFQQQQQDNWNNGSGMPNGRFHRQQPQQQPYPTGPKIQQQHPGRNQLNMSSPSGVFPNQQFSQSVHNEEEGAYMRKPLNPHRNQGKQKKARPTDYREL